MQGNPTAIIKNNERRCNTAFGRGSKLIFLSNDTQNNINIICTEISSEIVKEILDWRAYLLIADTTKDISRHEQLSICSRILNHSGKLGSRRGYRPPVGEPQLAVTGKLIIRRGFFTDDNTFIDCTNFEYFYHYIYIYINYKSVKSLDITPTIKRIYKKLK